MRHSYSDDDRYGSAIRENQQRRRPAGFDHGGARRLPLRLRHRGHQRHRRRACRDQFHISDRSRSASSSPRPCWAARSAPGSPARSPTGSGRIKVMLIAAVAVHRQRDRLRRSRSAPWDLIVLAGLRRPRRRRGQRHRTRLHRRDRPGRHPRPARLAATARHRHRHLRLAARRLPARRGRPAARRGTCRGAARPGAGCSPRRSIPAVIYGVLAARIPESPRYLVRRSATARGPRRAAAAASAATSTAQIDGDPADR